MSDFTLPPIAPLGVPLVGRVEKLAERAYAAFPDEDAYAPIRETAARTFRMIDAITDARD